MPPTHHSSNSGVRYSLDAFVKEVEALGKGIILTGEQVNRLTELAEQLLEVIEG